MTALRAFEIRPKPCPHDVQGSPHHHLSEVLACVVANGNPGIELIEQPLGV